jgi:hypothetical protein
MFVVGFFCLQAKGLTAVKCKAKQNNSTQALFYQFFKNLIHEHRPN